MFGENVKPEPVEQTSEPKEVKKPKKHKIMTSLDDEVWDRLWSFIKKKYRSPWRALSATVREALIEYLERHESEYQ